MPDVYGRVPVGIQHRKGIPLAVSVRLLAPGHPILGGTLTNNIQRRSVMTSTSKAAARSADAFKSPNVIPFPSTEETRCKVLGIELHSSSMCTQYIGTKKQLLAANVATPTMFPKKRSWAYSSKRSDPALGKWDLCRICNNRKWLLTCHKSEVYHD